MNINEESPQRDRMRPTRRIKQSLVKLPLGNDQISISETKGKEGGKSMNIYEAAKAVKETRLRLWRESDAEVWYADDYGDLSRYGASYSFISHLHLDFLTAEDWRVTTDRERRAFIKELKNRKLKKEEVKE